MEQPPTAVRNTASLASALLLGALLAGGWLGAAEPGPWIGLGQAPAGSGLSVPSAGDGENGPVQEQGQWARRVAEKSSYLYVRVEDESLRQRAPLDLYVTAEVSDAGFRRVALEYDKAAATPSITTAYTASPDAVLLTGHGGWRTICLSLPQARLGHGQNHGTDFRFCASGLVVRRIAVSAVPPADCSPGGGVDRQALRDLAVQRPAGMELTFGNDASPADAALFHALSVTSVESYVDWAGVEPQAEGTWDWAAWDRQVATLEANSLKWVPFLIAGSAYATPLWFQDSPRGRRFVCLEHGRESKVQSIFNPDLPRYVDRFLAEFAARYRERGVIESVLLGITGVYGESIYPAGPEGGWTAKLTGDYHNHAGWWAGDPDAAAAFRRAMQRRYHWVWRLNRAWGTKHPSFDAVVPFLPDQAPGDRARADFVEWYQQAMTDWAVTWVKSARRHFPATPIYLCTGGDGTPLIGADFTAQTKAIAPWGAGVRITNESSDYAANFTITREVATATRLYRTFAGFEPAGEVNPQGVVARLYNATASGARQLHYYHPNVLDSGAALGNFRTFAPLLVPRTPVVRTALYVSRESWAVEPASLGAMYDLARGLRDLADYDMVTRTAVADHALATCRSLVLTASPVLEPDAAEAIEDWVRQGGLLVTVAAPGQTVGERLYDQRRWRDRLLASTPGAIPSLLQPELAAPAPDAWTLEIGADDDGDWLFGDWSHREPALEWPDIPNARKRWSGARPGILLPTQPGQAYAVRLEAHLAGYSVEPGPNPVLVNGTQVGVLDRAGRQVYEFSVPATTVGDRPLAKLELCLNTWVPSERSASSDTRALGVALHRVDWRRAATPAAVPAAAALQYTADRVALAACSRPVRRGWTVSLSASSQELPRTLQLLGLLWRQTPEFLAGCQPVAPQDGRSDGVFVTELNTGRRLVYTAGTATIREECEVTP